MGRASPALTGFNAGEFSPTMEGRVDEDKYPRAAHIQSNFIPLKQGPATYRPGTAFVQPVKTSAVRTWLRKFEFSQTQAFIIEFGNLYLRFFTLHGPLLATGIAAYNGATAYVLGNLALSGGIIYYCIAPTTGNAPPNATFWYPMPQYQGSPTTAIYEIPSPYAGVDLTDSVGEFALQVTQSGDVLYVAAGNPGTGPSGLGYPTYTLTRFANAPPNWQFAIYSPIDGPFLTPSPPLLPGNEIALYVSATQGTAITITAVGGNVFAATDVGRLVRIASGYFNITPWNFGATWALNAYCTNNGHNYRSLSANGAESGPTAPIHTFGAANDGSQTGGAAGSGVTWLYTDSGYGVAQITGYTSPTSVTAKVLVTFPINLVGQSAAITGISQANPAVVTAANTFSLPLLVSTAPVFITGVNGMTQVNQTPYTLSAWTNANFNLSGIDSTSFGAWTSGGTAYFNASTEWMLGSWSHTTEWPQAVAFFKDRLFLKGKLNVWGSVVGDYPSHAPDFFGQQTTDAAINVTVPSTEATGPGWLSEAVILLVGTPGGEYGLDSANYSASPLGPTNVEVLKQSKWRCRPIEPLLVGTTVLYVQRAGRKLFAMDYNFYLNRYDSTDQSKFAYHMTIGGITAIAVQQEPWCIVWATRADGTLLSYTFNREDQVTAWARHNLGGGGVAESIAVIPAPDGLRDELWMVVNRTVNGAVTRTVEYMVKPYEGPQAGYGGDAQASAWYVDCGVQFIAGAPNITGISINVGGNPIHGYNTTCTVIVPNTAAAGQTVAISGVQYTGTFPINGSFVLSAATPTTLTFNLSGSYTFMYLSGGTAAFSAPSSGTTNIIGIPSVLWNQTVSILADGGVQPQQVVSGTGTLTLTGSFVNVILGFPYQGNLVPMRPEAGADVGTSQGKIKQGAKLVVRMVDSYGAVVGQLSNQPQGVYQDPLGQTTLVLANPEIIQLNLTTTGLDQPPPLQSGDFPVSFPTIAGSDQDARDFYICVQQNLPLPCTVVGLFPSYTVQEPR